ncbi:hypothetical protein [Hymenobacter jeollabukensis]|uniref:Lipocalin-like domain-containing protein n=1 Tax=Hymenobacter jeollabukensis TaxID=2025313 RepID=A0A5R8WVC7_9BACT|nr:hypothetical protein [Hymenobacter jeollabukensis]TLM95344.1 hypothetical protein FDY95_06025 [Hymenobacter jeollabukensis]
MKTLRFPLLLALTAATLLTACDKDKDKETVKPQTPTELLVGKDWKLTACTVSPAKPTTGGRTSTDYYNDFMPSYDRDDLFRFEKPNTFRQDEGPTRAPGNTTHQAYNGTWSLTDSDKVLRTEAEVLGSSSYDVLELSENTLRTSGSRTEGTTRYTYTYTFAKQ